MILQIKEYSKIKLEYGIENQSYNKMERNKLREHKKNKQGQKKFQGLKEEINKLNEQLEQIMEQNNTLEEQLQQAQQESRNLRNQLVDGVRRESGSGTKSNGFNKKKA